MADYEAPPVEKKTKISRDEIKAIVKAEITNCDGTTGSQLAIDRADNLDRYYARPYGNEVEGRSSVVTSDVRDTVEWVMPTLMRIFASGEEIAVFEPEEEADIEAAEQATKYIEYIWNRDNPGFLNLYTWFKDALISKNGVVKIYYNKSERTKRQRFTGLDDATFAKLVNAENVVVSEHSEEVRQIMGPVDPAQPELPPQLIDATFHDLVLTKTEKIGRVCVDPMPPEEFLLSRDARNIESARLAGHKRLRTLSDLIEDGFDRKIIEALPSDEIDANTDAETVAGDSVGESSETSTATTNNKAMRQVWVTEAYIKVDVDGDGIAEMRKVTVAGDSYEILSDEAWDAPRPFVDLTPIIVPHRRVGLCLADLSKIYQLLRTTLFRQYLDNTYLLNNQREEVLESAIVDPTEVLSSKPGQKIRVKAMGSVAPIIVPQIGEAALAGLSYVDQLKENSTGVSARTQGLGTNALHETMGGEQMLMSAAMGKIELIARVFAETGVKDAFRLILKLITMYQDQPRTIRITGKEFVPFDPTGWNPDMDMTVSVGVGTGDRQMQMQAAGAIGGLQEKLFALGMVSSDNAMNMAEMVVNATGQKGVERFFTKPDPNAPPKPDPEMAKVQAETQAKTAQMQMEGQIKTQQMQAEGAIKTQTAQADVQLQQQRLQAEMELKRYQTDQELALKREQLQAELILKREQMTAELALKRDMGAFQMANGSSDIGNVAVGGEPG